MVGNVRAMARAIEVEAHDRPLEVDDLLSMHGMLMSGSSLPIGHERAGKVREGPVFIGGTTPANAEYVGPPYQEVPRLLNDLVGFINTRSDLSGVIVAAIAHAQFQSIHPFHDGNGRVGRCLIHTILRRARLVRTVSPPVSVVLARRGKQYIEGLNIYRRDDLDGWISVFATAVRFASTAAQEFGRAVMELESQWRERLEVLRSSTGRRGVRDNASVLRLIAALPGMPVFQIRDVSDRLDITWKAAEAAVLELQAAGVITEVTAGKRNRVFEAPDVFQLVERFEREPDVRARRRRLSGPGPHVSARDSGGVRLLGAPHRARPPGRGGPRPRRRARRDA